MEMTTATAIAHPNIALIKYWGNRDETLRIPANSSLSVNLDGLVTRTTVTFLPDLPADRLELNGSPAEPAALARVSRFLDRARALASSTVHAMVVSQNNFPTGAGIASSAAAFAALSMAASRALGLNLDEKDLSRLARLGSGSACRSVPAGFVEWNAGTSDSDSYAFSVAPSLHWDLVDCITVVASGHKSVGSTEGHALAGSSPLQAARVADATRRLNIARRALLQRDFPALAEIVEQDSSMMHAVMMTSSPPLYYWEPPSLAIMKSVQAWRKDGLPCCFTLDAGANVHVICPSEAAAEVSARLAEIPTVTQVLQAHPGGPAQIVE
jgi:diphosphomevalonate decarboxylase